MIGLVNAIGAGQAAREQHARPTQATEKRSDVGEPPMWVRPSDTSPSPTESTRAVQPAEFRSAQAEEHEPEGAQPHESASPPAARPESTAIGQALDMVA